MKENANSQEKAPQAAFHRGSQRLWHWRFLSALLLAILFAVSTNALEDEARKARSNPPPEYPELARKLSIRGIARVQVTVAPDGTVKEVKELGGNPVLVAALTQAVKKWKYEPADKTS